MNGQNLTSGRQPEETRVRRFNAYNIIKNEQYQMTLPDRVVKGEANLTVRNSSTILDLFDA
jgi:hypothetical protein